MPANTALNHSNQPATTPAAEPAKIHESVHHTDFHQALSSAQGHAPQVKEFVHRYEPDEYAQMKTFLHPDKKSGFAVKPDGDIVSVFSTEKGRGDQIVNHAKNVGGTKLDAFDGYLPKLYGKHGFKEYKREANWTPGKADVVYMKLHKSEKLYQHIYLHKNSDALTYKKFADNGMDLMYPVSVHGKTHRPDIDVPYHTSIKVFNPDKDAPHEMHRKSSQLKLSAPDAKEVEIEPSTLKGRAGNTMHVLKLHGKHADAIKEHHKHFVGHGHSENYDFHPHVTVDEESWHKIKNSGAKTAHEAGIKFHDAELHHKNKVIGQYGKKPEKLAASEKFDSIEKGAIKNIGAIVGLAGALNTATPPKTDATPLPKAPTATAAPSALKGTEYSRKKMLNTISQVESNGGKNENHKELGGMHHGESAFGKYGLTPVVIRETIHMNPDLNRKYRKATKLQGDDLHRFMEDNPGLEDAVADKHLARLEHHFGQDPSRIGYAWLEGISGTYKAQKDKKDIGQHWHVKKINQVYSKGS